MKLLYVTCREASTGEYEWVREYQYEVSNMRDAGAGSTYLLRVGEGTASYLDLNTRMKCTKRTRSSQGGDPRTEFPRPSKVSSLMGHHGHGLLDHISSALSVLQQCNKWTEM